MAQTTLNAQVREQTGAAASRRSRRNGRVPAVGYGRGGEPTAVLLRSEDVQRIVAHRVKMVTLSIDAEAEQMLVKDVQLDTFGEQVLHVDFERVAMDEALEVECPVELTGTAKGVAAGGVLEHPVSDLTVSCLPRDIPEVIKVGVSHMGIGDSILVKDIKPPDGVKILTDPDAVLVTIRPPAELEAEEKAPAAEAVAGAEEPEVIGREKAEEEDKEAEGAE